MKIWENGKIREATEAELAELEKFKAELPDPAPTSEERLAALEKAGMERDAALMELAAMLAGGV